MPRDTNHDVALLLIHNPSPSIHSSAVSVANRSHLRYRTMTLFYSGSRLQFKHDLSSIFVSFDLTLAFGIGVNNFDDWIGSEGWRDGRGRLIARVIVQGAVEIDVVSTKQ